MRLASKPLPVGGQNYHMESGLLERYHRNFMNNDQERGLAKKSFFRVMEWL